VKPRGWNAICLVALAIGVAGLVVFIHRESSSAANPLPIKGILGCAVLVIIGAIELIKEPSSPKDDEDE
jgi:hypothetical protein